MPKSTAASAVSTLAINATTNAQPPSTLRGDMLKEIKAIAGFLDLPDRQVYHLCATGQLPGVFKLGRLYHARRSVLLEHMIRREQGEA